MEAVQGKEIGNMEEIIAVCILSLVLETAMASQALCWFSQGNLGFGLAFLFGIAVASALALATIVDFAKKETRELP